jgi:hypothetical protein
MQFKEKIEAAALPLITELRRRLKSLPTIAVLNRYQLQHHLSQFDTSKFPDGFWTKWRYLWALLLSGGFLEEKSARDGEENFTRINELIEEIFELYRFGAIYEPGRSPGSEKEFLTRLGLGLKVREPDTLGFPDQIKSWALARFRPFNDSSFLPVFGLRFEELFQWIDDLIRLTEAKLNGWINDMVPIVSDLKELQRQFADGTVGLQDVRNRGDLLKIGERLDSNGRDGEALHLLSDAEIQQSIPKASLDASIKLFGIKPGGVGPEFVFPHHENPLEYKLFVTLPNASFYLIDPASAHRVMAKTFENRILDDGKLRERYLLNRGRATENLVVESARKVFPKAAIYPNYYLQKGSREKDVFIRDGNTVILIECKNSRVRAFTGATDDLVKFESDFKNSVQYGYEQAHDVKRRILENEETTFLDAKWLPYFSVKNSEIERIYIICVTVTPRGPFGTDLSYELKKENDEPFPLALGLFDFETICNYFDAQQFIRYLEAREDLHGRVSTGDELNYAGYFLKFGNLDLQDRTFVADDFSGIFDRKWYRQQGMEVEEPAGGPVLTSMVRKGNRVKVEYSTGQKEVIRLPEWVTERTLGKSPIKMKGSDRNKPCPCGSGLKLKRCCGIS